MTSHKFNIEDTVLFNSRVLARNLPWGVYDCFRVMANPNIASRARTKSTSASHRKASSPGRNQLSFGVVKNALQMPAFRALIRDQPRFPTSWFNIQNFDHASAAFVTVGRINAMGSLFV
jgi:hypothetical protein